MYDYQSRDPRVMESRKQIAQGLLFLLEREPFEDITVTQICQEAQIARATFYRNFAVKKDIIKYILIQDITQFQQRGLTADSLQDAIAVFFEHIPYSRQLLRIFERNNMFYMFDDIYSYWEQIYNAQKNSLFPQRDIYDDYKKEFFISVPVGIMKVWTARDFRETPQELAETWRQIVHQ